MNHLFSDIRYGFRVLLKNPAVTVVALLTLALGIGANSAIFSVVNSVVLRPLPYAEPEQLVTVFSQFPTMNFFEFWTSEPEYLELRAQNEFLADIGGYRVGGANLTGDGDPVRLTACVATATMFSTLGVDALLGRAYGPEEDAPGAESVVLLSYGLWSQKYASDPDIVGKQILLDDTPTRIVGVMPASFAFPSPDVQAWEPIQMNPASLRPRSNHYLRLVGRLKAGVNLQQARTQLKAMLPAWDEAHPGEHSPSPDNHPFIVNDLHEQTVGDVKPAMLVLMAAVGFVLLIACVNVANLLLARADKRQKEIAVRTALGAERARLIRQLLTESSLLALTGGALGLVVGNWGVQLLLAVNPSSVPRAAEIGLDWGVAAFTLAVALLTGLLFGLAPVAQLMRADVNDSLKEGGRGSSSGSQGFRRLLVVVEVAVAVVLLIGAGLMIRSFWQLQAIDTGFVAEQRLTLRTVLSRTQFSDNNQIVNFYDQLLERLNGLAGVRSVGFVSALPLQSALNANDFEIDGWVRSDESPPVNVDYQQGITPGYLRTMGVPVVAGRDITASDRSGAAPVALVSESFVQRFWPNENPLGKRVRFCCGDAIPWLEVVGVVGDVRQGSLTDTFKPHMYLPVAQLPDVANFAPNQLDIVLETTGDPLSLARAVREQVWSLDSAVPISHVQSMSNIVEESLSEPRFTVLLLTVFAATALVLSAIGIFGVLSYAVSCRVQEIGVRMAIGAQRSDVISMMVREGMALAAIGLAVGLVVASGASRFLQDLLFGVGSLDASTYATVAGLLALVSLFACWLPARRATRIDPVRALQYE